MATKKSQSKQGLSVDASSFTGSQYSQIVGVTVTDKDITLEFVYINPRDKTQGEVVSRVTLPSAAGESLAETIKNIIAKHKKKN